MSISEQNSVLLLGAGASKSFGLALGAELVERCRKYACDESKRIKHRKTERETINLDFMTKGNYFHELPILSSLFKQETLRGMDPSIIYNNHLDAFASTIEQIERRLNSQTSETIDDFIAENPSLSDICKIIISIDFFKTLYSQDNRGEAYNLKNFRTRFLPIYDGLDATAADERNWVHSLINISRQGIRAHNINHDNPIQIVTFNYDTVLEDILQNQFSNSEVSHGRDFREFIRIYHFHGSIGKMPDKVKNADAPRVVASWSSGISTIAESTNEQVNQIRSDALSVMNRADQIYATGFAFSPSNCEALGLLESRPATRHVNYSNYDGSAAVRHAVQRIVAASQTDVQINEAEGTPDRPMTTSNWFSAGYTGDLLG